jgi:hypothetical protein
LAHIVELEGFDDRRDELHPMSFRLRSAAPRKRLGIISSSRTVPQCSDLAGHWNHLEIWNGCGIWQGRKPILCADSFACPFFGQACAGAAGGR